MAAKPCPHGRPTLFQPQMIRALLDGRKTQTRRALHLPVVRWLLQDPGVVEFCQEFDSTCKTTPAVIDFMATHRLVAKPRERCFLWVRENYGISHLGAVYAVDDVEFFDPDESDDEARIAWHTRAYDRRGWGQEIDLIGCPSIHMPRWASRLTLEVGLVRLQHLQDIGEEDAIAEGIGRNPVQDCTWIDYLEGTSAAGWSDPRDSFRSLWASINGRESWAENPLVCAISFRIHHVNIDDLLRERGLIGDAR